MKEINEKDGKDGNDSTHDYMFVVQIKRKTTSGEIRWRAAPVRSVFYDGAEDQKKFSGSDKTRAIRYRDSLRSLGHEARVVKRSAALYRSEAEIMEARKKSKKRKRVYDRKYDEKRRKELRRVVIRFHPDELEKVDFITSITGESRTDLVRRLIKHEYYLNHAIETISRNGKAANERGKNKTKNASN